MCTALRARLIEPWRVLELMYFWTRRSFLHDIDRVAAAVADVYIYYAMILGVSELRIEDAVSYNLSSSLLL